MPKLPSINIRVCVRALQKAGFEIDRTKDHIILIRHHPFARVAVPNHPGDIKPGTVRSIIRQSGLTVDEFIALLK